MFYDGICAKIDYKGIEYVELFINPSIEEVNELYTNFNGARGFISDNNDIYIWNPNLLHANIVPKVKNKIDCKSIRFNINYREKIIAIDANHEHTYYEIENALRTNKSIMDDIFKIKEIKQWNIWNTIDLGCKLDFNYDILNTIS